MDSYKHNFQTQRDACFSIREMHVNVFKKYPVSNNKYIKYMIPNSKYTVLDAPSLNTSLERDTNKDAVRNQLVLGGSGIGSCEGKLSSRQGRLCL